jgi:phospholipid/cholesterol/gamma-HCH transport system substrate-binding protein
MRTAIRKHLRDFIALAFVAVIGLAVAGYILSNQRFYLPDWVPGIGTDFYQVKAELSSGQAVVPGQGQTVNVAGVKVGEVGTVELEDGKAVIEMNIQEKYAPIYKDATILLRPKTGLKDMLLAVDPGTKAAGELPEGGRVEVGNTLPDVNPDEILAELDADTRAYLRVLLSSGADAFTDERQQEEQLAGTGEPDTGDEPEQSAAADLRETFKRFEPTGRDARRLTLALAKRRRNVRRVIHNFQELATELGTKDSQLAGLVDSTNANFEALAAEEANLRESVRLLPGTLGQTETTLRKAGTLARELGPTLQSLRPAARALGPSLRQTRPFLRESTPIIRTQLRPFARDVRPVVRDLRSAAEDLAVVTPRAVRVFKFLNALVNTLAYNPRGSEEGYLFWASWVNHAGATVFGAQDAHGPIRRGLVIASCSALQILDQIGATTPQLQILIDLLNAPRTSAVCPTATPPAGVSGR